MYSLYQPEGDYETHEFIQLYTSEKGIQPLFKLIDKKVYKYFRSIFKLFEFLPKEKNIEKDVLINIEEFMRQYVLVPDKFFIFLRILHHSYNYSQVF